MEEEISHLPREHASEMAELADMRVMLHSRVFLLHFQVLANQSGVLCKAFSGTAPDSWGKAVEVALGGENLTDTLMFLTMLYDPFHIEDALEIKAPGAPASPIAAHAEALLLLAARAEALLLLADKLDCKMIAKAVCDGYIVENDGMLVNNWLKWLVIADRHNAPKLRAKCAVQLVNTSITTNYFGDTAQWRQLRADTLCMLYEALFKVTRQRRALSEAAVANWSGMGSL